ncbi:methyltransferase [Nocardiopsis kunsanensis]|uniref:methyltransferase n=1 Tax=Nocardiopsis kunsanensis TaxID=141693 RepID=UPI00034A76C9|nr:methyltransferase [Nocardiopsis kunsanensis]
MTAEHTQETAVPEGAPSLPLFGIAFGYMSAQMLHVFTRLGLADRLAEEPRDGAELAVAVDADAGALERLLRASTMLGLVRETEQGRFELTPQSHLLRADVPGSVRPFLLTYFDDAVWHAWGSLEHSVRTGESAFEHTHGVDMFTHFSASPELNTMFHRAMSLGTAQEAAALAAAHDFTAHHTVVDVGGGNGTLLSVILSSAPGTRGVLLDTADGTTEAAEVLNRAGAADRCEVLHTDFLAAAPPAADAYVLKSVLHDWDDERCRAILRNVRAAMPDDAVVLVVELLAPETTRSGLDPYLAISDVNLLVTTSGRERTETELTELLSDAGLAVESGSRSLGGTGHRLLVARSA